MSKSLEDLVRLIDAQIEAAHGAVDSADKALGTEASLHYARISQARSALADVLIQRYHLQMNEAGLV